MHTWNDATKQIGNKAIAGLCLGVNPANHNVGAWGCNSEKGDSWITDNTGQGVRFWNQQARDEGWDGRCLDANEAGIYLNGCNDGDNQRWYSPPHPNRNPVAGCRARGPGRSTPDPLTRERQAGCCAALPPQRAGARFGHGRLVKRPEAHAA
ncbi:hypothetical protein [Streptomyces sp. HUAS TT7]|uniref:hypothetical protein n=1 Tax=Streptomyces sp. HUAS TT7 TaxID=3447507 RepID=UPI003F657248